MADDKENLYSQLGEELIIREFFQEKRGGFYVDIGAAWGDRASTTLYLDKELGWRGIGVDALAFYSKTWGETRLESTFLNYAVSDTSGETIEFYQTVIPTLSTMHPEVLETWNLTIEQSRVRQVETMRLDDILESQGVTSFDFLSIDTEGSEPKVLRGFTISRYRPALVCIEAQASDENNVVILDYFESNGYIRMTECDEIDPINWYFRRRED